MKFFSFTVKSSEVLPAELYLAHINCIIIETDFEESNDNNVVTRPMLLISPAL